MAEEPFSTYHSTRPAATLPLGANDVILVLQNGSVCALRPGDLGVIPTVMLDASLVNSNVLLPASGGVRYIRSDDSGNDTSITPSVAGQTVLRQASIQGPDAQDEFIILELIGTNWCRTG